MSAKNFPAMKLLVAALVSTFGMLGSAVASQPVHSVRGHAVDNLVPTQYIDQITINAWVDEDGVVDGSIAVWPGAYLYLPDQVVPDYAGWTWVIRIRSLHVIGSVATAEGIVVFDNRFTSTLGCSITIQIWDLGDGGSGPVDYMQVTGGSCVSPGGTPLLYGGNFTVR